MRRWREQRTLSTDGIPREIVVLDDDTSTSSPSSSCSFECSLCLESSLETEEKFVISGCNHFGCKACMTNFFTLKITSKEFPIKCPICSKVDVKVDEICSLLPQSLLSKFHEFSLKKTLESDPEWRCCLHPGCENGVFWNENDGASPKWTCDSCRNTFCLKCKDLGHDGSCQLFQTWKRENGNVENKLEELLRDGTVKLCPCCSCPTQKREGCNFLVCSQCRVAWCWHCAKKHENCFCGNNPHRQWEQHGQFNFPQINDQDDFELHDHIHQLHQHVHVHVHQHIHHQVQQALHLQQQHLQQMQMHMLQHQRMQQQPQPQLQLQPQQQQQQQQQQQPQQPHSHQPIQRRQPQPQQQQQQPQPQPQPPLQLPHPQPTRPQPIHAHVQQHQHQHQHQQQHQPQPQPQPQLQPQHQHQHYQHQHQNQHQHQHQHQQQHHQHHPQHSHQHQFQIQEQQEQPNEFFQQLLLLQQQEQLLHEQLHQTHFNHQPLPLRLQLQTHIHNQLHQIHLQRQILFQQRGGPMH